MSAYYNEFDPRAAAWLRELIADGLIAPGDVDERSITEVTPDDLHGYTQCHFFAGIGGWSYAARLAGWPDDRPLWTGSCPCQPFSAAGTQQGEADARHLWPEFRRLIAECRPATVIGEQVASALGRDWLAGVRADLEGLGYAVGAADLCAASRGAPHRRQRLFWVADAEHAKRRAINVNRENGCDWTNNRRKEAYDELGTRGEVRGLANAEGPRSRPGLREGHQIEYGDGSRGSRRLGHPTGGGLGIDGSASRRAGHPDESDPSGGLGDASGERPQGRDERGYSAHERPAGPTGVAGPWDDSIFLPCLDGKTRRTQSGLFPLVDGLPRGVVPSGDPGVPEANATAEGRVMRLRGYGNAIVPQVAATFLRAYMESR